MLICVAFFRFNYKVNQCESKFLLEPEGTGVLARVRSSQPVVSATHRYKIPIRRMGTSSLGHSLTHRACASPSSS